jgi:hypothetical protein
MELEGRKGYDVINYLYVTFMLLWYPAVCYFHVTVVSSSILLGL